MTPQKAITLADDVFEQVKQRAEAEGVSLDEAANEALRLGLSESRWQTLVTRGRTYSREMADAKTDEEAIRSPSTPCSKTVAVGEAGDRGCNPASGSPPLLPQSWRHPKTEQAVREADWLGKIGCGGGI